MIYKAVEKDPIVECMQYLVDNVGEIDEWMEKTHTRRDISNPKLMFQLGCKFQDYLEFAGGIPMSVEFGDYIVKRRGLFYLWKKDAFDAKYRIIKETEEDPEYYDDLLPALNVDARCLKSVEE